MRSLVRGFSAFMGLLFVFAAVLQYNDPDPLRWMALYLSAAGASLLFVVGRLRWYVPALVGLIAVAWAGTLVSHVWGHVGFSELFAAWEMANPIVEEGREMYGLLIAACWMALLLVATLRRRSLVSEPSEK